MYTSTDSTWPQQYMGIVHVQIHICIYAKKQSEKTNCETRIRKQIVMTSQHQAVVMCQWSKFDTVEIKHFLAVSICMICVHSNAAFCQITCST